MRSSERSIAPRLALVTGAGGFLGRHVARRFSQEGWRVLAIGHGELSHSQMQRWGVAGWVGAEIAIESLLDLARREGVPDLIFHGAGGASVGLSLAEPLVDFERTVSTTAVLIEFMRRVAPEAKLIYPSSAAVYGVVAEVPIREGASLQPVSPYGTHKLLAERLCIDASREFGLHCSVIRFFSLFGPELRKQLLWDMVGRLNRGQRSLELDGDGGETRDFMYVEDASRLIALVANAARGEPVVVNGASGVATTVRQVADTVIKAMGLEGHVETDFSGIRRKGDPRDQTADITQLHALGFRPEWPFDAGVEQFVRWAEQQRGAEPEKGLQVPIDVLGEVAP